MRVCEGVCMSVCEGVCMSVCEGVYVFDHRSSTVPLAH